MLQLHNIKLYVFVTFKKKEEKVYSNIFS